MVPTHFQPPTKRLCLPRCTTPHTNPQNSAPTKETATLSTSLSRSSAVSISSNPRIFLLKEGRYAHKLAVAKIAMDVDCGGEWEKGTGGELDRKELWDLCDRKEIKYIDFNEGAHEGVMVPLQSKCDCFTCLHHTRGYIAHLVACDEINWSMLLMM